MTGVIFIHGVECRRNYSLGKYLGPEDTAPQVVESMPISRTATSLLSFAVKSVRVRLWPCKTGLSPPVTLCY